MNYLKDLQKLAKEHGYRVIQAPAPEEPVPADKDERRRPRYIYFLVKLRAGSWCGEYEHVGLNARTSLDEISQKLVKFIVEEGIR